MHKTGSPHRTVSASTESALQATLIRQDIALQAQHIIHTLFPAKLVDIHSNLIQRSLFSTDCTEHASVPAARKKRRADSLSTDNLNPPQSSAPSTDESVLPCNVSIVEMIQLISTEIESFAKMCNTVKIWIQINVSTADTSTNNNSNTGLREEMISELSKAEDAAFEIIEMPSKYHSTRAKLASKAIKYGHTVPDYHQAINNLDYKQIYQLRLTAMDLRNNYASLYDMLIKNYSRL